MGKNNLKFSDTSNTSSIEKEVPVAQPEVVSEEELAKTADMYHDKVYTAVPRKHDLKGGIFPEDQGFSAARVFLWDTFKALAFLNDRTWKKVEIRIPKTEKRAALKPMSVAAWSVSHVPNTWPMEEVKHAPQYVE